MMSPLENDRGLTLTELVVVIVLAGVVTLGLVSFYFNSQTTWVDGSTQAMTQREATGIVKVITDEVHRAESAVVSEAPDSLHEQLALTLPNSGGQWYFWWNAADSLVHQGPSPSDDRGPIGDSKVETFELDADGWLVYLKRLRLRSANGQRIEVSTSIQLVNHSYSVSP